MNAGGRQAGLEAGCRYHIGPAIGRGGMAVVHAAWACAAFGCRRRVAAKILLAEHASDPDYLAMLLDEARLSMRIEHPGVVTVRDVLQDEGRLVLIMDYLEGVPLAGLLSSVEYEAMPVPLPIACRVMVDVLDALEAIHEAKDESGLPLQIVHRDVSPQNIVVATSGHSHLLDLGVAKARLRAQVTRHGERKGKPGYMAPEQLLGETVDRRADVFGVGVVLWEALSGARFPERTHGEPAKRAAAELMKAPSGVSQALCSVVARSLADQGERFGSAREMADALREAATIASTTEVQAWVRDIGAERLAEQARGWREFLEATLASHAAKAGDPATETTMRNGPQGRGPRPLGVHYGGGTMRSAQRAEGGVWHGRARTVAIMAASLVIGAFASRAWPSATGAGQVAAVGAGGLAAMARHSAEFIRNLERRRVPTMKLRPNAFGGRHTDHSAEPAASFQPRGHGVHVAKQADGLHVAGGSSSRLPGMAVNALPEAIDPLSSVPIGQAVAKAAHAAKPPRLPEPSCSPPYDVDETGVRTYKAECL